MLLTRWPDAVQCPARNQNDKTLIQSRSRMIVSYIPCQMLPWVRKIDLFPPIFEMLAQRWYHCVQYTKRHHMNRIAHCWSYFPQSWFIGACCLFLRWPAVLAVQTTSIINSMLKYANSGRNHASNVRWCSYDGAWCAEYNLWQYLRCWWNEPNFSSTFDRL